MKLIDKYLLRQHLQTLFYCLLAFSMIEIVIDLFDHLPTFLESRTRVLTVLRYYLAFLGPNIDYILPASLLLATLYTLWQLTRHGEITAMRATGVSFYRIAAPFLAVGFFASLTAGVLKETVVPQTILWSTELAANDFREDAPTAYRTRVLYYNRAARRQWIIDDVNLAEPSVLRGVEVTQERKDGTLATEIRARRADWLDGEWWFFDASVQAFSAAGNPVEEPVPIEGSHLGKRMPQFNETPRQFVTEVKNWEFFSAREMVRYLAARPSLSSETRAQKLVDLHLRFAMPWACLIVTLFGIPAGALSARQSVLKAVLFTVSCFFVFYALMQVGIFLGKRQAFSPWLGAWLSNIVFLGAGVRMLLRIR